MRVRGCDSPGCSASGDHRAPRNRDLNDYYWFCLDHVRDYNNRWDYFAGMSGDEVEDYNRAATVWERPSWPMGEWKQREQQIRDQVMGEFFGATFQADRPSAAASPVSKAERDALAVLELAPSVDFAAIKQQYRVLVKQHHPDANGGSHEAGERFKAINQAFAVLKKLYEAEEGERL